MNLLDWKEQKAFYLRDGKCWAPLFFEDIKADASIAIDIRVENLSLKSNLQSAQYQNSGKEERDLKGYEDNIMQKYTAVLIFCLLLSNILGPILVLLSKQATPTRNIQATI